MRTTIDLPDALLEKVRARLQGSKRTLREVVIESLQLSLRQEATPPAFRLADGAFKGPIGFQPGFAADRVTEAIYEDVDDRLHPSP